MGGVYISPLRSLQYFTSAFPPPSIRLLLFPEAEGCVSSHLFPFLPPKLVLTSENKHIPLQTKGPVAWRTAGKRNRWAGPILTGNQTAANYSRLKRALGFCPCFGARRSAPSCWSGAERDECYLVQISPPSLLSHTHTHTYFIPRTPADAPWLSASHPFLFLCRYLKIKLQFICSDLGRGRRWGKSGGLLPSSHCPVIKTHLFLFRLHFLNLHPARLSFCTHKRSLISCLISSLLVPLGLSHPPSSLLQFGSAQQQVDTCRPAGQEGFLRDA